MTLSKFDKERRNDLAKDVGGYAFGVLFWILLWAAIAFVIGNPLVLAGPAEVVESLVDLCGTSSFWNAVCQSCARILTTSLISCICALPLGAASYKFKLVDKVLAPIIQVMKSAPVACIVVIILLAWGAEGAFMAIIAFVSFPPAYVAMRQALTERPRRTEAVLETLGVSRSRIFLACIWPASTPFFTAAAKTAVGLSWRAGITAELLSLPLGSIGSGVYASKLSLDSGELMVWTIAVMLLSWINEKIVVALISLSRRSGLIALPRRNDNDDADETEENALSRSSGHSALELVDITVSFDDVKVLESFSMRIDPGTKICLMAPTGTGKSTAISILAGIKSPNSGESHAPDNIALVLQHPSLIGTLTAIENVELATRTSLSEKQILKELSLLLPETAFDREADKLSGGMKRLTEIARAMLSSGDAVILDEPFSGLDDESRKAACKFILTHLDGRALLIATHDSEDAELLDAGVVLIEQ